MANIETGIMQGDPTPILIANAWAFGAQDYDPFPLFQIMRRNAEVPGAKSQDVEERPGLKQYLEKGYYNASEQLEYTSSELRHRAVRAARPAATNSPAGAISTTPARGKTSTTPRPAGCSRAMPTGRGNRSAKTGANRPIKTISGWCPTTWRG